MVSEQTRVRRWRAGHVAAALRQRELMKATGANPRQAIAESLAALAALEVAGLWPGPRDPVSEAAVHRVRARWARIQRKSRAARLQQRGDAASSP